MPVLKLVAGRFAFEIIPVIFVLGMDWPISVTEDGLGRTKAVALPVNDTLNVVESKTIRLVGLETITLMDVTLPDVTA